MKVVTATILFTMLTGLVATLWGFQRDITTNTISIQSIEKNENSLKDDIKYIRLRIDKIYEVLIGE